MDISAAVSTMVNNIAAQTDPAHRSNVEIMNSVAEQIRATSTTQMKDATEGVGTMLLKHVDVCIKCNALGTLDEKCKIGMLMLKISEKTFKVSN